MRPPPTFITPIYRLLGRLLPVFVAIVLALSLAGGTSIAANASPLSGPPHQHTTPHIVCCGTVYTNITNYQGFDACSPPTSSADLQAWWSDSSYAWIGFYIGGKNDTNECIRYTSSQISTAQSQGWSLVPIYDGYAAPCVNSPAYSFTSSSAYSQGVSDANDAMSQATAIGLTDAVIYEDMEAFNTSDSTCAAAVNAYVSGWSQTVNNSGKFTPGLYESASNVVELNASPMPSYIYIAGGGCQASGQTNSCTVWNNGIISNGWWVYDQRLYQYAWNFKDSYGGTQQYQVDADAANGMVWGQGGGDAADAAEGSSESLSSDP